MADQPYQLLPPLTADEYAALRDDIAAHGIRVPIDVDEHGAILDGHHRQKIADELGIPCPVRVLSGLTDEDKREHAMALNLARRHLTQADRRRLVAAELRRDDTRSDRRIARIVGVDHKTVGAVRRRLADGESPHPDPETANTALAEAEGTVGAGLTDMDRAIIFALSNRIEPALIIGWLTAGMFAVAAQHEADDYRAGVRQLFESRIRTVLADGHALTEELTGPDVCRKPLEPEEIARLAARVSLGAIGGDQ